MYDSQVMLECQIDITLVHNMYTLSHQFARFAVHTWKIISWSTHYNSTGPELDIFCRAFHVVLLRRIYQYPDIQKGPFIFSESVFPV
jgi:hypothetical protein